VPASASQCQPPSESVGSIQHKKGVGQPQLSFLCSFVFVFVLALCCLCTIVTAGINNAFKLFSNWEKPKELGLWHLFDDCMDSTTSGQVAGLASVGVMCDQQPAVRDVTDVPPQPIILATIRDVTDVPPQPIILATIRDVTDVPPQPIILATIRVLLVLQACLSFHSGGCVLVLQAWLGFHSGGCASKVTTERGACFLSLVRQATLPRSPHTFE
jgi:hypothetical protein